MEKRNVNSSDKGSAFLLLLPFIIVAMLLSPVLVSISMNEEQSLSLVAHTTKKNLQKQNAEIRRYLNDDYTASNGMVVCLNEGGDSKESGLCLTKYNDISGNTPLIVPPFDYNTIFSEPFLCIGDPTEDFSETPSGFALSDTSIISAKICNTVPEQIKKPLAILGNLYFEAPIFIGPAEQIILMAASGYLDINSTLSISADTLIVAGGDLRIKKILAPGASQVSLTLISATGKIVIEESAGNLEIYPLAKVSVLLPPGSQIAEQSNKLPSNITEIVLGFAD